MSAIDSQLRSFTLPIPESFDECVRGLLHEYIHKPGIRDKDVNWRLGKRFSSLKIVLLTRRRVAPQCPPIEIPSTLMSSLTDRKEICVHMQEALLFLCKIRTSR